MKRTSMRVALVIAVIGALLTACGSGSTKKAALSATTTMVTTAPATTVETSSTSTVTTSVPVSTTRAASASTTALPALPPAPWASAKLAADKVPAVLLTEWRAGGARADCALLAPVDLGPAASGTPRRADFGDRAWAVAWDVPGAPGRLPSGLPCTDCGRGTVVVAGTGVDLLPRPRPAGIVLPNARTWAGGNVARYGLEGGTGPAFLAQLEVAGQMCQYNVVSFLGQAHLERVLESLRFVVGAP